MKNQRQLKTSLFTLTTVMGLCGPVRADIASNLAAYLKMDETTGLTATDATAGGHAATLFNFPGDDSQWVAGRTNGACAFNAGGVNYGQYGALADPGDTLNFATMPAPAVTVAAWVQGATNFTQLNGAGILCRGYAGHEAYAIDTYQNRYRFYVRDANVANFIIQSGLGTTPAGAVPLCDGSWQHLVGVFDSTAGSTNGVKLYVNGLLVGSIAGPTTMLNIEHEVSVGSRDSDGSSNYTSVTFSGLLDDVRIYNRALSAADVLELYYAAGVSAPSITTQPQSAAVYAGDTAQFAVASQGTQPLSYQWRLNTTNLLSGATNATLALTNLSLANAGSYDVVITNIAGGITSAVAVLTLTNPPVDIASGLVTYAKLDETTGIIAADATGLGHDATLQNFPGDDSQWVAGRTNGACYFNTNYPYDSSQNYEYAAFNDPNDDLNFANSAVPAVTVAAWVQGIPGFVQTSGAGILCRGYGGHESYAIDLYQNSYRFYVRDASATSYVIQAGLGTTPAGSVPACDGFWQHVVGVFDSTAGVNAVKLYVNGLLVARLAGPASLYNIAHEVSFGNHDSGSGYTVPFAGKLDDVRVYNRALSPKDVQALYFAAGIIAPVLNSQPQSLSRYAGDSVGFSVGVDGTRPFSYQWRWNTTNLLAGQTNSSLTLTNLQITNSGNYDVVVTNIGGSVTSTPAALSVIVNPYDFTNGLVAWLTMDDAHGLTEADATTNTHNATLYNFAGDDTQWVSGRTNGACYFNASGSASQQYGLFAEPAASQTLNMATNSVPAVTVAAWLKGVPGYTQVSGAGVLCRGYGSHEVYCIDLYQNRYRFYVHNASGTTSIIQSTAVPLCDGTWQHVVGVFDSGGGSTGLKLYVNGQLIVQQAAPTSLLNNANQHGVSLGNRDANTSGSGTYSEPFVGRMDDVRIYNRPLSTSQVGALFSNVPPYIGFYIQPVAVSTNERSPAAFSATAETSPAATISYQWQRNGVNVTGATASSLSWNYVGLADAGTYQLVASSAWGSAASASVVLNVIALPPPDLTNNLVAYYKFDETSGITVHDSSGNGLDATLYNWATGAATWEPGILGGALHFNGGPFNSPDTNNNYVLTPPLPLPNNSQDFTFTFWAKRDSTTIYGNPKIIEPLNGALASWVMWKPGSGIGFYNGAWAGPEPSTTAWHVYAVTFNRTTSRYDVYVDGLRKVLSGVPTSPATETDPTGLQWVIGHLNLLDSTHNNESFRGWLDDLRIYNRVFTINDAEALYEMANFPPTLSMQVSAGTLTFSWPSWAEGYVLKRATSLAPGATWTAVPGSPTLVNTTRSQTDALGAGAKFYRLAK
jgi:hypothetical protein